jgi:hypothetical protein
MKNRTYALSQEWVIELKNIENNINFKHLNRHISILHTCEVMIDFLNDKKINPYKLGSLKVISSYYFAHTYHQALSIYHLSKLGLGSSGLVLVRSIIESLINLSYLWLGKRINGSDDERNAWMEFVHVSRHKMDKAWEDMQVHRKNKLLGLVDPEHLFDKRKSEEILNEFNQFKSKYNRDGWAIVSKIEQRARKVDDLQVLSGIVLEETYHSCYRWTSEIVHGMSGGSDSYFEEKEKGLTIDFGPNFRNVDILLPMASRMMIHIISLVNHLYHLNIDLTKQLEESGFTINTFDNQL